MKQKIFISLALVCILSAGLILTSCSSKDASLIIKGAKSIVRTGTPAVYDLESQKLEGFDTMLGAVAVHHVCDSEMLLMTIAGDYCFMWLDINTGASQNLLRRGRGPEEMDFAGFGGTWRDSDGVVYFEAYSINMKRSMTINLTESLAEHKTVVAKTTDIPAGTMYSLADGVKRANYIMEANSVAIRISDMNGENSRVFFPFGTEGYIGDGSLFFSATSLVNHGNDFILAMSSMPRIGVINTLSGETRVASVSRIDDNALLNKLKDPHAEWADCYTFVVSDGKNIYALCSASEDDARKGYVHEIQVLDLKTLRFVYSYKISEYLINFVIQHEEGRMIGITPEGDLLEYKLPS